MNTSIPTGPVQALLLIGGGPLDGRFPANPFSSNERVLQLSFVSHTDLAKKDQWTNIRRCRYEYVSETPALITFNWKGWTP